MKNFKELIKRIKEHYPSPILELDFKNPYELLVGLVLSARCQDKVANRITKELFKHYPSPAELSQASIEEVNELISSCSMHNNKAKNLKKIAQTITEQYNGKIPNRFEELVKLPGVADKTANMVLSFGFGIPAIGVDTHVIRTANRLGISASNKSKDIENDIKRIVPEEDWIVFYAGLILLGRYICRSKKPLCNECFLNDICPKIGV